MGVEVGRVSVPGAGTLAGVVSVDPERLLTGSEVARLLGIKPATWRSYVHRGYAPRPDDPGVGPVNNREPRWRLCRVREFLVQRRGQGRRTDLGR